MVMKNWLINFSLSNQDEIKSKYGPQDLDLPAGRQVLD